MPSWDDDRQPRQLGLFDKAPVPRQALTLPVPAAPLDNAWRPCAGCRAEAACAEQRRCNVFGF